MQIEIIEKETKIREHYSKGDLNKKEVFNLTKWAFNREKELLEKWGNIKIGRLPLFYKRKWSKVNKEAGLF